jgi:hypothetical protein
LNNFGPCGTKFIVGIVMVTKEATKVRTIRLVVAYVSAYGNGEKLAAPSITSFTGHTWTIDYNIKLKKKPA